MIKRFLFVFIIFVCLFLFCKNDPTGLVMNFQGLQLVYEIDGQIFIINEYGSGKRLLCAGRNPCWSPLKDKIAFFSNNCELCLINIDGSERKTLTRALPDSGGTYMIALRWAPDASRILFCSSKIVPWSMHLINADGTGEKRVVTEEGGFLSPKWSPDGNKISFTGATRLNPTTGIFVANQDGADLCRLLNEGHTAMYGWYPNSQSIAFTGDFDGDSLGFNTSEIYSCGVDGSNLIQLTHGDNIYIFSEWNPTGDKIVFLKKYPLEQKYIGIMDPDGSSQSILKKFGPEEDIAWVKYSFNGMKIAYVMNYRQGNPYSELRVMNSNGSNDRKLDESNVPRVILFDWSAW